MTSTHLAVGLAVALVVALVTAALFGANGLGRHERLRRELREVRAVNESIRVENRRLEVERRALRHDPAYIEAVIKDDLGYVHPGEVVLELEREPGFPKSATDSKALKIMKNPR